MYSLLSAFVLISNSAAMYFCSLAMQNKLPQWCSKLFVHISYAHKLPQLCSKLLLNISYAHKLPQLCTNYF